MNMFKEIGKLLTASGLMLVLAACGPGAVVYEDHQYTVDIAGLERDDSAAPTIIYRRPDAPRLNAYNRFIIDPVKITSDDPALEDMAEEDVQRMQTYLREAVIRELRNGGYEVGTTPEAGTMRISFTLSGLKASQSGGAVNTATMAAGIAIGLPIGIYSINVGEVTVEGVFRNALTNQIDGVAVAHSEGAKVFKQEFWSTWADVEGTFDDWAEGFRKTVEEAHGRQNTVSPLSLVINAEMRLMIDYEELVGAMTAGFEDVISSVAYSVVLDDENRLEWRGMIDGKPATEKAEPLASR